MAKICVIIPNYNGLRFLEPCMDALYKQTYRDFEVLIVDNGSTDGSVEYIRNLGSSVRSILLSENTGFTGAVNAGISACKSEYIVLLNNDTKVFPDYLEKLAEAMDADCQHKLFAVTPMMIKMYEPGLLDDAGDGMCLAGWAFQRGAGRPVTVSEYNRERYVFSACAGAAMYRADVLDRLQLKDGSYFDPAHFAYLEDMDISFRAGIQGYRILYLPSARVLHAGSGTSGSRYNSFKVRLSSRNNVYLVYKNMPLLMLLVNLPFLAAGTFIKLLFFIKTGYGKDYLKGASEGIRNTGKLEKVRFKAGNIPCYLRLELELFTGCFSYIADVFMRKVFKK